MANESVSEFARYLTRVQSCPRLSREEELSLFHRWQHQHDERAKDELVRASLRYSVIIARKYRHYDVPLCELVAEGNIGLAHALTKFDTKRGTRFVTYAVYWIRAYVLNCIINSWSLVGVGTGSLRSRVFFKLRRERSRLMTLVGDEESAEELLAQHFGVSRTQISSMLQRIDARDVSLDAKVYCDETVSIVDTLAAPDSDQEDVLASSQLDRRMRDIVRQAVDTLDPRERTIIRQRLMQSPEDELSLAEIGKNLNVTRERVRQLEMRAKQKLKQRILEMAASQGLLGLALNSAA
jgi:RNA polymerase sigma-32 factor